ncbi:MAG: putative acetamidase/formamidase [Acidobacteriaceae bacterium]|nr:putative acetamidase/formamidase [Acidobacteriaceae bacterium]
MFIRRLALLWLISTAAYGQQKPITGDWVVELDFLGSKMYNRAELVEENGSLSGVFMGQQIVGRRTGNVIAFAPNAGSGKVEARVVGEEIRGTNLLSNGSADRQPLTLPFVATRVPKRPSRSPVTHAFKPVSFYRSYSALNPPALHLAPGDTVRTETVDNGGSDSRNFRRTAGGDPQTGPFYVDSVMPGDVLVVHILS